MNRQMRRMLNKNTKDIAETLKGLGVELNSEMFKEIQEKAKNPKNLLSAAQELRSKTEKLEKLLVNAAPFETKPLESEIKINYKPLK